MRVTRSLMLLSALALSVAGCASQPVYVQMAPNSLDGMAYGAAPAAYGTAPMTYGTAPMTYATAPAAYATAPATYAAAPATYAAASTYAVNCPQVYSCPQTGGYNYAGYGYAAGYGQPAYTLDSGDRLRIVVFGQDGLTNSYAVDASGHIAMPLIGSVMAKGLSTDELSKRIADKLKDGYIREPHVAVEVEAYRPFFILGEVTQPGQYPYVANMTAETAVAIAGGFAARAVRQSVTLIRNYNGQQMRMSVPLTYPLRPGDTVSVQERWF
jgi:polysaccharide export outer membrane protein